MEQEFVFEDTKKEEGGILKFLWNGDRKEFLGRDGASWAKVSLFYAIFYTCLGSFFVGMLAVFMVQMPKDKPTYYGESSTMSARGVNPGLGFRPQVDVEDHLIMYDPAVYDSPTRGYKQYVRNLENFLQNKYQPAANPDDVIQCQDGQDYTNQFNEGKACSFDFNEIFKSHDCHSSKDYGFKTNKPCVLLKLNKIISWKPHNTNNVTIKCAGETSADKDNLKSVLYHSDNGEVSSEHATLNAKYFPFMGQKAYHAPFVYAQFDVAKDTLVNIECKAYAPNIDNSDRLNRRGMTKFSVFVAAPKN